MQINRNQQYQQNQLKVCIFHNLLIHELFLIVLKPIEIQSYILASVSLDLTEFQICIYAFRDQMIEYFVVFFKYNKTEVSCLVYPICPASNVSNGIKINFFLVARGKLEKQIILNLRNSLFFPATSHP